ncbi:hypothetical protein BCR33DRAFT_788734 [Rhizoclosmatium globosum]|uniref:Uncharacterized protein n=1 Tax=Rhizoclosmatium globosum TaxID=329046 RepID=A0A1Y2BW37_9FUNG|nr:hypothetical protein BCR33DRAFT_788734 [Rhizoclosmatium globosum]|eukprot:ORY38894.1 hypothetical protein BCR33DRAFT_788734 [Rhizoclosmatium globosum]
MNRIFVTTATPVQAITVNNNHANHMQLNQDPATREFDLWLVSAGLLASLFFTPVLACIALCFADSKDIIFKASYGRGLGFGFFIWGVAMCSLSWMLKSYLCVPTCLRNLNATNIYSTYSYSYYDASGTYYKLYSYDTNYSYCSNTCNMYLFFLIPVGIIWIMIGLVHIRTSKIILNGSIRRVNVHPNATMVFIQAPPLQPPPYPTYAQAAQQQHPPYAPQPPYNPQHKSAAAPSIPESTQGTPNLQRRMSLESLALHLQIPNLLNVKGGIDEVMNSDHQQLSSKYGITNEEFIKIKGYKKLMNG